MKTYEQILQEKIAYYGNTEAAREFAAREYYEGWIPNDGVSIPNEFERVLVEYWTGLLDVAFLQYSTMTWHGNSERLNAQEVVRWRPIYHD